MSTAIAAGMTAEELFALPEDGMDRELIRGQLKEKPISYRNRFHTRAVANASRLIGNWVAQNPKPKGEVHSGEVGCILRRDPDTTVGIDVAYFSADVMGRQSDDKTLIEGAPKLAVEVLSHSDKTEEIRDKVLEYLAAGVELVWVVDPYFHTVTVYWPGGLPEMFNSDEMLTGGTTLPGLEIAVADLFR
jgi:Uma2 family endonuclease